MSLVQEFELSEIEFVHLEKLDFKASSDDDVLNALKEDFAFLDSSPFFRGQFLKQHWHSMNAQSVTYQIHKRSELIIDVLCDLLQALLTQQISYAQALQKGRLPDLNLAETDSLVQSFEEKMDRASTALEENKDFACKAGYLYRDSWWRYYHGEAALQGQAARERGAKAGAGGGKASRKRRDLNLKLLIEEIEQLSDYVGKFSEERIVAQAIEAVCERDQDFPESKKTLDNYGTALRSEEPFKTRYEAVFGKNA